MAATADNNRVSRNPRRSPWLSIWFRPGDTIEQIIFAKSWMSVLLLAGLGGAFSLFTVGLHYGWLATDWRNIAILTVVGFVSGVAGLFFNAFFFRLWGMLLGGHASQAHIRAALAWSMLPNVFGFVICLAAVIGLKFVGAVNSSQPAFDVGETALKMVAGVVGIWTLVLTVITVKRVQRFGIWRAIANIALGWFVGSIALALTIRIFLFQPFSIPSAAMMPTLLVGDYMFVSKYAYGYTHFSVPFSPPLVTGRIFPVEPHRGDVVVFRLPRDTTTDYVKRMVGLPGDRIQMVHGQIILNETPVKHEQVEDYVGENPCGGGENSRVRQFRETLPNGVSYNTLDCYDNGFLDNTEVYTVPEGHYFMMGDNRDNSADSRIPAEHLGVGYVPFENLIGRVEIIFLSIDRANAQQPRTRYERFGMAVR